MNHFALSQREMLEEFLFHKKTRRFIAKALAKAVSSISDEIKRNSERGVCKAGRAHWLARERQKERGNFFFLLVSGSMSL